MRRVADSSWLYALADGADAHHRKAKTEAERQEMIHVPPAVLVETLGLIQYRAGGDQAPALAALEAMAATANMALAEPEHDHEAAVRIWEAHPRLTYADAAAVAAARRLGVGLATFDKEQLAAHTSGTP